MTTEQIIRLLGDLESLSGRLGTMAGTDRWTAAQRRSRLAIIDRARMPKNDNAASRLARRICVAVCWVIGIAAVIATVLAAAGCAEDAGRVGAKPAPAGAVSTLAPAPSGRTILFDGATWHVKHSGSYGPGPNAWHQDNVWVDAAGALHLQIAMRGGVWTCAEVWSDRDLSDGTYTVSVESDIRDLGPNTVLGAFLYRSDDNEIDILEASRWGEADSELNGQWVIQPATPGRRHRYQIATAEPADYGVDYVAGTIPVFIRASQTIGRVTWTPNINIPLPATYRMHLNLWLMGGLPPIDGQQPPEVIISRARRNGVPL